MLHLRFTSWRLQARPRIISSSQVFSKAIGQMLFERHRPDLMSNPTGSSGQSGETSAFAHRSSAATPL